MEIYSKSFSKKANLSPICVSHKPGNVVAITTAQLNSAESEPRFLSDSNAACNMFKIGGSEDL